MAWITIEGTVIDYPVMYRPTQKNYYLHRDFNGNHASAGALFIAENCDPDDSDNVIIYGHNMNSGKMFAALNKYKKQSFYEEHSRIVYETLNGHSATLGSDMSAGALARERARLPGKPKAINSGSGQSPVRRRRLRCFPGCLCACA